ncbi:MAG TPA: tetratricopeptide repeat protein [Anaerolineae bacterium]|nr:tetratricopeptide repeat protein [Anaerolineae bacterium]
MSTTSELEKKVEQAQTTIERIDALNNLAWETSRYDHDRTLTLINEIQTLSTTGEFASTPYQKGIACRLRTLARLNSYQGNYGQALQFGREAATMLEELEEWDLLPHLLNTISSSYSDLGDHSTALEFSYRQLELSEKIGNLKGQGMAYVGLGVSHINNEEHDAALNYFHKSLGVFRQVNDTYWVALNLNNISYVYFLKKEYDKAIEYGQQSMAVAEEHNHPRMKMAASNSLAEVYIHQKDFDKAAKACQIALNMAQESGSKESEADALRVMGDMCYQQEQYDDAIPYLQKALTIAEEIKHKRYAYRIHQTLAAVYKAKSDYHQALIHHEQFFTLKDEVFNEESQQKQQNLQVLHRTETAKKEADHYAALYATEQARRQLAEVLNEVGQTLINSPNIGDVLDAILQKLQALVPYDRSILLLRHQNLLVCTAMRGYEPATELRQAQFRVDLSRPDDVIWQIYQNKEPIALTNTTNITSPQLPALFAGGAWLGVPLLRNNDLMGILTLARTTPTPFKEDAITATTTLAVQTAIALENAQLYKQSQQRAEEMTTLAQIGRDIASTLNLETVLERLANHAHSLFKAHTTVLRLRGQDDQFYPLVTLGTYADQFQTATTTLGEGITGDIAATGIAEIIPDPEKDPRALHVAGTPDEEETPVALLCAPITTQNRSIGLLLLYRDQADGVFTEVDLNFVVGLTRQAAVAIENAQLYRQIKTFNQQLEDEVSRRTADLQEAYRQLERLDQTKSRFIAITAHELRTPITVLKGYAQIIKQSPQSAANVIDGMVTGTNRLLEIVNTMLVLAKIDSRELELSAQPLDCHLILKRIARDLADDVNTRQQTLIIDESIKEIPTIYGDGDSLKMVFSNIIRNGIKYTPDGGAIRVHGRHWTTPPQPNYPPTGIEIIISDTGIGIAPEAIELIFTKFYQTGTVAHHSSSQVNFKGGGPGLGLAIARGIIEAHQGRLWAESAGYDEDTLPGSDFHIVLPINTPE